LSALSVETGWTGIEGEEVGALTGGELTEMENF
jgi:hypothetical protein